MSQEALLAHIMVREILHFVYKSFGHIICKICLVYWEVRDVFFPPNEKVVLFVAHPDDDTLFFHTFIKENKPYVVLCTSGWSLRRMPGFIRTMKYYGVRFRAYDMKSYDRRIALLQKRVRRVFRIGRFQLCATHNSEGEYGHEMHRLVHNAVFAESRIPVLTPTTGRIINKYPLEDTLIDEKRFIFNMYYHTEKWVIEQYSVWMNHEKLEIEAE